MASAGRANSLLKLYPYQLSSFLILFAGLFFFGVKKLSGLKLEFDKSFIFIFLFFYHTVNLTSIGPMIEGTDLAVGIFTVLFFVLAFVKDELHIDKGLIMLNLAFILSVLPSSIIGEYYVLAVSFLKTSKLVLMSFLLSACLYRRIAIDFFVKWFVLFAVVSSIIAFFQHLLFMTTGILFAGNLDPQQLKHNFELTSLGLTYRFSGFISGYKVFSNILILAQIFIVNYLLYEKIRTKMKYTLIVSSGFILTAIILTFSKDALMLYFLGLILSVICKRPNWIFHFLAALLLVFALFIVTGVVNDIHNAFVSEFEFGEFRIRKQFIREGIDGFLYKHPWLGVGIGKSTLYTAHFLNWPPHNGFLVALDETGVLGLSVFIIILVYTFRKAFLISKFEDDLRYKWIGRSLLIGFVCFLVTINFHPTYLDNILWMYLGVINGLHLHLTNLNLTKRH
jgi:hypothetical protein